MCCYTRRAGDAWWGADLIQGGKSRGRRLSTKDGFLEEEAVKLS